MACSTRPQMEQPAVRIPKEVVDRHGLLSADECSTSLPSIPCCRVQFSSVSESHSPRNLTAPDSQAGGTGQWRNPLSKSFRKSAKALSCQYSSPPQPQHHTAAIKLQQNLLRLFRRQLEKRHGLRITRHQMVLRLELEMRMLRGFRVIFFALIQFIVLVLLALPIPGGVAAGVQSEFGLMKTYHSMLGLQGVDEVQTTSELRAFLAMLLERSRSMQVLSNDYFTEGGIGEIRITNGISAYSRVETLEGDRVRPHVDGASFTLTAWVESRPPSFEGAYVVRRPLGAGQRSHPLSCWGWWVGDVPRFDFGAHDYTTADASASAPQQVSISLRLDDGSLPGGQRRWSHSPGAQPSLHMEAVVVNQTAISFYQDAQLVATSPLPRPVTDCASADLELGKAGSRQGEVTAFPRGLTQHELSELLIYGNTLSNIAVGRTFATPQASGAAGASESAGHPAPAGRTAFEVAALAEGMSSDVARDAVPTAASRTSGSLSAAGPRLAANTTTGCTSSWPSCFVMDVPNSSVVADPELAGRSYLLLTPRGAYTLLASADVRWPSVLHYEPATFPRWRGHSMTVSAWVQVESGGALLTKQPSYNEPGRCWSVYIHSDGLSTLGGATVGGFTAPSRTISLPTHVRFSFVRMKGLRHVAMVFDEQRDSLTAYVDGVALDEVFFAPGQVAQLDCASGSQTYYGLGHEAPGSAPLVGQVADTRIYVGHALNASEVHRLAFAVDSPRSCVTASDGIVDDGRFLDPAGNGCLWHHQWLAQSPAACSTEATRVACPIACGLVEPCLVSGESQPPTAYSLYPMIQRSAPTFSEGVLCAREGLDLAAECRSKHFRPGYPGESRPEDDQWPPPFGTYRRSDDYLVEVNAQAALPLPNASDCDLVARISDAYCTFPAVLPNDLDGLVNTASRSARGFTVSFWIQSAGALAFGSSHPGASSFTPSLIFYSSIAPVVPLLVLSSRTSGLIVADFFGRCNTTEAQSAYLPMGVLDASAWNFVAMTYDPGQHQVRLSINGATATARIEWPSWCPSAHGSFIDAIGLSALEMLISGVEVIPTALSHLETTLTFYRQRGLYALRPGPLRTRKERLASPIHYDQTLYTAPAFLIAPPIVRVDQQSKESDCSAASFGSRANERVRRVANSTICQPPYECSSDLSEPTTLLSCSSALSPSTHLGQTLPAGHQKFTEFLATVADVSMLLREGVAIDTAEFVNAQTVDLELILVVVSPQFGIVSRISVRAQLGPVVRMSTDVIHYQSVHSQEALSELTALVVIGFITIIICAVFDVAKRIESRLRKGVNYVTIDTKTATLVFDVFALVLTPFISLILTSYQGFHRDSKGLQLNSQLSAVPWAETHVSWEAKMQDFDAGLDYFDYVQEQQRGSQIILIAACVLLIIRLIVATAAHPRIAMMVNTVIRSLDDLGHLILLVVLVFCAFALLGYAQFGRTDDVFSTPQKTFDALWAMSVDGAGAEVAQVGTLGLLYMLTFAFLLFFLSFNVIIAIVVESFLRVKREVEDLQVEYDFLSDTLLVFHGDILQHWHGWPTKSKLIKALKQSSKLNVGPSEMLVLIPNTDYWRLSKLFTFYSKRRFPFLAPENNPYVEEPMRTAQAVGEIENRIARLLEKPPSTPLIRLQDQIRDGKSLGTVGFAKARAAGSSGKLSGKGKSGKVASGKLAGTVDDGGSSWPGRAGLPRTARLLESRLRRKVDIKEFSVSSL